MRMDRANIFGLEEVPSDVTVLREESWKGQQ